MDATQAIQDFPFDDGEENVSDDEEETQPVAKLKVFTNEHVPETELLLYPGENIVGRDGAFCTVPLPAPSMSKRHATISITVFRSNRQHTSEVTETLIWDMGSLNGTRKGRLKLKPHVRYALTEGDKVTLADLPCQYVPLGAAEGERGKGEAGTADCLAGERGEETNMPEQQSREVKLRTEMGAEAEPMGNNGANGERGCLTPRSEQGGAILRGSQDVSPRPPVAERKDQTPAPLVPESDAESDGEREGWRPRAGKSLVSSDSDSPRIPQPTCSTFQSPSGASYIPESPSSSVRGRVNETLSSGRSIWTDRSTEAAPKKPRPDPLEFNMDSDTDVEGEEGAVAGAMEGKKCSPQAANGDPSVNLVARGSAGPASKHPDFGMDSDTDAEGEELKASEMNSTKASVGEVGEKPSSPAAAAAPADFHMESDTDVEDEVPHTAQVKASPAHLAQGSGGSRTANMASAGLHMDSDTDVEEEGELDDQADITQADASAAGPDAAQVKPEAHQSHNASDSADATDPFKSGSSKTTEACPGQQPKPATALEIQSDSDTDVEDENVRQPAAPSNTSGPSELRPVPEAAHGAQAPTAGAGAESDQDTDVEEGVAGSAGAKQQVAPPAVTPTNPDDFNMDSDTDVEEEVKEDPSLRKPGRERAFAAGIQSSTPVGAGLRLEEMETQLFLSPSDQFARPLALPPLHPVVPSEDSPDDDDFVPETQSFVAEPEDRGAAGMSALDETSLEETELFCKGGQMGRSPQFQLSMSDSSRLQQLASEPTQAYTFPGFRDSGDSEKDSDLDATQDYGALQATQAYAAEPAGGEEEDPHAESATAETQAFFMAAAVRSPEIAIGSAEAMPPPQSDAPQGVARPEVEEEATQLTETDVYSHLTTISTADTVILHQSQKPGGEEAGRTSGANSTEQLTNSAPCEPRQANVPVAEFHMDSDTDVEDEEEDGGSKEPQLTTGQMKAEELQLHSDSHTDDEEDPFRPAMTTTAVTSPGGQESHTTADVGCAETQPMSATNDDEEEEEPNVAHVRRKSSARRRHGRLNSQPSETLLIAETQPVAMDDDDTGDKVESPKRRGKARRGKGRQVGDEGEPVAVSSSCLTTDQTQPMAGADEEDEEEEVKPVGPRRRGRALRGRGTQVEDGTEPTETQINSCPATSETQPMSAAFDDDENREEEAEPRAASPKRRGRSRKGKEKQEEEESKPAEMPSNTQPLAACDQEEEEEEEESTQTSPSTSRAKTRRAGKEPVPTRSTRGRGAAEEEQQGEEVEEETSVESRRQTRGKTPAVKRGGRRRGEAVEVEEAEEKPVQEVRRGRGRKSVMQQKQDQEERERLEREKEQQEKERMERERREQEEREEKKRLEEARLERDRKEEMERLEKEMKEKEERERREKEEKERKEQEEKERLEKERIEKERQEKEERERIERERKETEEREKLEKERLEKERKEKEERERIEREQREKEEKERKEQEERKRLERERLEKERQEKEEQERLKKERKEREQREKKEAEERERMEKERLEKERKEKEEEEKIEKKRQEKEEKDRKEAEERDKLEKERLEKERKEEEEKEERERGKKENRGRLANKRNNTEPSKAESQESGALPQAPTRGRRAASRRTAPAPPSGQEEPVQLPSDDCPARRTRSRSSSSNSVSSERSTSSVRSSASTSRQGAPESHAPSSRRSSRRTARGAPPPGEEVPTQEDGSSQSQSGRSSRRPSTSSNSVCSEVPDAASVVSESRGRGRGRGRGRKSVRGKEPEPEAELEPAPSGPPVIEPPATTTAGRGRRGRKAGAGDVVADGDVSAQTNSEDRPAEAEAGPAPRGRRGAKPEPGPTAEGSQTEAPGGSSSEASVPQKTTGRGRSRGQRAGVSQSTSAEEDGESANVNNGDVSAATSNGRGKKRSHNDESEELDESEEVRFKIPRSKGKAVKGAKKGENEDSAGGVEPEKKEEEEEETAPGPAQRKGRGRQSVSQKKKEVKKEVEGSEEAAAGASTSSSTPPLNEPEAQEASDKGSRKRGVATAESPTPAKSARRSVGTSRQAHKVLFTGVSDESGEAVVARLGGSMAKGVSDMTHLVTDAVRRTVKFMCAVARGVPIVTPDWLKKCGKVGSFLPTDEFLVKDPDQEKKFKFRLEESLSVACSQPLLQGYEIHVTRSVKPEPAQMKDIITSCGARYLPKMPSVNKPQTVVVSCAEDAALCSPALAASVPIVTSEFLLTGILQQQVDVVAHALSITQAPARGRKKT